ncbi:MULTISPECIES: hypothetical protein [unclassified Pseudoxanthomonas]|uniref:hypothetical protein n=1 Tax=unclassified Pseudoxanthomonas TaxID=2645906 RepID=UPI00307FCAA9
MIRRLARLFARPPSTAAPTPVRVSVQMHWFADTQLPIPDWASMHEGDAAGLDGEAAHAYWDSAAQTWLEALRDALGTHYRITGTHDFLLLSPLEDRPAQVFLATCQRMRARITRSLGELADDGGWGRHVVMVFEDPDDYYAYVSHYYPEGGEYAMSSGMFIQAGYGHFVMPLEQIDAMEPVIAHELTHCLLTHLPIPAWLNEGLAVNTEHTLFPQLAAPHAQLYFPHEIAAQHAAYWDADSIQAFWSGKSFLRTDEGNRLSYDLAKKITRLAAGDEAAFRLFVAHAHLQDGGLAAEHHLGFPLAHLVEAVLGEGPWQPLPDRWSDGVERGQFGLAPHPARSRRGA